MEKRINNQLDSFRMKTPSASNECDACKRSDKKALHMKMFVNQKHSVYSIVFCSKLFTLYTLLYSYIIATMVDMRRSP